MSHVMFAPDGVEAKAESVLKNMIEIRRRVSDLRPDILVLIGGDHFNNFSLALQVPLAIAISERFRTLGDGGVPVTEFDGDRHFAEGFSRFAARGGMEIVRAEEIVPDHGMAFPKLVVDPQNEVPTVLLYVNSGMPVPPSPERCHRLGMLLKDYVEKERGTFERVIVLGLGGLSHWLRMPEEGRIAVEFDLNFLEILERGDAAIFASERSCDEIVDAAGNGGLELLAWLAAAGAAGDGGGKRLFYEAMEPWITGMAAIELHCNTGNG